MTEIPEHLLKRAKEAREKAGGVASRGGEGGIPNLLSSELDVEPKANPHDPLDWSRFGLRPMLLAKRVFDFVGGRVGQEGYADTTQRFARAGDENEFYTLSQMVKREIGDGLYLRIGHVLSLEVQKPTSRRVFDVARNLGSDAIWRSAASDTAERVDVGEFRKAAEAEKARKHSHAWAELLVDVNGSDERGIDMLTSFGVRLAENPEAEPDDLAAVYWGSGAQVIHPLQRGNDKLEHYGYYTLGAQEYVSDDATLSDQNIRLGSQGPFRWVGGSQVEWARAYSDGQRRPNVTDVVETAMTGLDVSLEMMIDPHMAQNADEHNRVLQNTLSRFI